jgi:hypothetical protein
MRADFTDLLIPSFADFEEPRLLKIDIGFIGRF